MWGVKIKALPRPLRLSFSEASPLRRLGLRSSNAASAKEAASEASPLRRLGLRSSNATSAKEAASEASPLRLSFSEASTTFSRNFTQPVSEFRSN